MYEDLPPFIKEMGMKVIVRKWIHFFYFEVVKVCSFVFCSGVCKSGLSSSKTKFEWDALTGHKGIKAAFSHSIPSFSAVQFIVQLYKLNGLGNTHRKRIFVVELKTSLRPPEFRSRAVIAARSSINWTIFELVNGSWNRGDADWREKLHRNIFICVTIKVI